MSNDPLALSGIGAGLAQDAEYDAVYAAVTATERGRWFLTEYANRNRHADTDVVVSAIARIEAAIGDHPTGQEPSRVADINAAAERISDIAIELRDRAADGKLCDALDIAVREICDACASPAEEHVDQSREQGSEAASFDFDLHGAKFAAAATALEASLTSLNSDARPNSESESRPLVSVIPPQDYEDSSPPQGAKPDAPERRWHIEAPDFVFDQPSRNGNGHGNGRDVEPFSQAMLPEPASADPEEDPADLFEPQEQGAPFPRAPTPPTETAAELPPQEPRATITAAPAPIRPDPLAALNALSDDERIALFG